MFIIVRVCCLLVDMIFLLVFKIVMDKIKNVDNCDIFVLFVVNFIWVFGGFDLFDLEIGIVLYNNLFRFFLR